MIEITKEELRSLIRETVSEVLSKKKTSKNKISPRYYTKQNTDIESLIGSIPFILLDKKIFQKNMDVVEFAEKLGIIITSGEKKKIDEIVGRIITAISEFPQSKIIQLNNAIRQLKTQSIEKKDKKSFLDEWDKVIKSIKL